MIRRYECGQLTFAGAVKQFTDALHELGRAILCVFHVHDDVHFTRANGWDDDEKVCLYCARRKPL